MNAHTLKFIARSNSRVQERAARNPGFAAYVLVKEMAYDEKTKTLTSNQLKVLRAIYYRLIPHSLLETIRSLGFGADLPSIGGRSLIARTTDRNPYRQVKSIAVVSAVGDTFDLQHVGFGNSGDHVDIADWRLDDLIESKAKEAIGSQFAIKDVAFGRGQLAQASLINAKYDYEPDLKGLTVRDDVDAYLVFPKHPFQFRDSTIRGQGVGMVRFGSLLHTVTNVFTYYDVALVDAHTLKVIRAMGATVAPDAAFTTPSRGVESALWADKAQDLTAAQKDQIHDIVKELIGASVGETLLRLDLTDKMIVDSWPLPTENAMEMAPPSSI